MAEIQPFPFETLKTYSSKEASLLSWLYRVLPPSGYEPILSSRVTESCRKYLGTSFSIRSESVCDFSFSNFLEGLPEKFACAVVSLDHHPQKILIELDYGLSLSMVDRILGGAGQSRPAPGPLTSLEEGVLQFFVVKILQEIENFSGILPKPVLDKIVTRSSDLANFESPDARLILATFRVQLQNQDGYLRFVIPQSLLWPLRDSMERVIEKTLSRAEPSRIKDALRGFDSMKTVVWAEAGTVTLTPEDLSQIERGDIILLDEAYANFEGQKLTGEIIVRVGQDVPGGIRARIDGAEKSLKVKIEDIFQEG